jgi:tRNA pseudouridine38-40 synthase
VSTRVIRVHLEYDGTNFAGWQVQPRVRTVQFEVEEALHRLTGERIRIHAAGRTDAGVHARNQVISFETTSGIPGERFAFGLNRHLPQDVCARESAEAPEGFHARYSAIGKVYDYYIVGSPTRRALVGRYAWVLWPTPDVERMRASAPRLVGEKDFAAFAASGRKPGSTVRCVDEVSLHTGSEAAPRPEWAGEEPWIRIRAVANGFLYKMVRNFVGALVQIGRGRLGPEDLDEALRSGRRELLPPSAPPEGLVLTDVLYPDELSAGLKARRDERCDANSEREA